MSGSRADSSHVALYDKQYDNFARELYADIRRELFDDDQDIGQNGWLSRSEIESFGTWLGLGAGKSLLDIACGSGGPALHACATTGCSVTGVDIHEAGIARAKERASSEGLSDRARFVVTDGGTRLAFDDDSFDALTCIDAVNHLPDRTAVLAEWRRLIKPGGRMVFTDPIVVTGPITDREMRIRTSIGFFLMVPPGVDEALVTNAGFEIERVEDSTTNMARAARVYVDARAAREGDLRKIEGDEAYEGQQEFFEVTAVLAEEKRLSRLTFCVRG